MNVKKAVIATAFFVLLTLVFSDVRNTFSENKGSKPLTNSQNSHENSHEKHENSHIFGLKWAKTLKLYAILHENSHKLYAERLIFRHPHEYPYLCSRNREND